MAIEIKNNCYVIDGEEQFLISGEFQYYRVPRADWEERLIKLKEMHGNCVSTYVPWIIHEPQEGEIIWGDVGNRDLCAFLELCQKLSLNVILRPGPLQYSELVYGGIPRWLYQKYPQVCAQRMDGSYLNTAPSYMHPIFLEKARKYYASFAAVVGKYMKKYGGPVSVIQVDNELMGCHVWMGTLDYNRETYGFGQEDGTYAQYLKNLYGTITNLNKAYHTSFASFGEVFPMRHENKDIYACRSARDYFNFYVDQNGEYLKTLVSWLREDGIEELVCHNAANASMNGMFDSILEKQEPEFLLGSDYYYNLNQDWKQNNPTPQYALTMLFSCEQLRNMGMPPTAMELPGGSCSDFPPILSEDLYACYATNVALGLKGLNFYIYTGGPNFADTGATCDIYDFNAFIHADGTMNDTYYAAQKFCKWLADNKWMQSAKRITSVNVAYENELFRSEYFGYDGVKYPQFDTVRFIRNGLLYSLMCSEYSPSLVDISKSIPDISLPLILGASSVLSRKSQENVVAFLKAGGKLIIMPTLPVMDEHYQECTLLKDYIGIEEIDYSCMIPRPVVVEGCEKAVYDLQVKTVIKEEGKDVCVLARNREDQKVVVVEKKIGAGTVIFGTTSFILMLDSQVDMVCSLLKRLGASEVVWHSNRHVFTSYFQGRNGEKVLFLMNLYSGCNQTNVVVEGKLIENIKLQPMEVKILRL